MEVSLAPIVLVIAGEPVLGDRAVRDLKKAVIQQNPNTDVVELDAAQYKAGELAALFTPSLFGDPRCVLVPNLEALNAPLQDELLAYLASPDPDATLILRHNGGQRGKKVVAALKKKVPTYDYPKIKYPRDKAKIVQQDVRDAGRKISAAAVDAMVAALGSDLRELLAFTSQLLADVSGPINENHVHTYLAGRVEASTFNVADAVVAGNTSRAVELTRHALATGSSPVSVLGAIASKLRAMAQMLGLRSRRIDAHVRMNEWQMNRAKADLRGWKAANLAEAIEIVARADAQVKGAARSPQYALEAAILQIGKVRRSGI